MRALLPRPACIARLNISSKPSAVRANNCIRAFTSSSPLLKFQLTLKQQDDTAKTSSLTDRKGEPFSRAALESLLRRRLFYTPAFEIYQGQQDVETRGLYDYGPPGCALQTNIVDLFRKHFILAEDMLEVDCTSLTPYQVLKTSGHVAKFSDWMCRDKKTEEILRADHVVREVLEGRIRAHKLKKGEPVEEVEEVEDVGPAKGGKPKEKIRSKITRPMEIDDKTARLYEELLAQLDNFDGPQLAQLITTHSIKNPTTGNSLSTPIPFNLMFTATLGPLNTYGNHTSNAFLRPETAQGQFMNFAKLLEHNGHSMPFASASIGKAYRNEISPRGGLLRVREFLLAEIEHYVDPSTSKTHPKFGEVERLELPLLPRETQTSGSTTTTSTSLSTAVSTGQIANETLAYFLARTHTFLLALGIHPQKLRYRQHMSREMAHYATDCWDAELLTSHGWIECVGLADRAAFDLTAHGVRTGAPLLVRETLPEPVSKEEWTLDIDAKAFGPRFRRDAPKIEAALRALSQTDLENFAQALEDRGYFSLRIPGITGSAHINTNLQHNSVTLDTTLLSITKQTHVVKHREYIPSVIEPSFGIGRLLYAALEHTFWTRADSDGARGVLSLPVAIAPVKVLIMPLVSNNSKLTAMVGQIHAMLKKKGVVSRVDIGSASIGKRYARSDELGTPMGVTVDFQSLKDGTVTLRERDGMRQGRGAVGQVVEGVVRVVRGEEEVEGLMGGLEEFVAQELEGEVDVGDAEGEGGSVKENV